jgi:superfamily II DNA or RNA helicase
MKMILETPTTLRLPENSDAVRRFLTFRDRSVDFQLRKAKRNWRWANNDPAGHADHVQNLEAQINRCLVNVSEDDVPRTYAGLWKDLENRFGWELEPADFDRKLNPIGLPWQHEPHKMYYYQEEAMERLMAARHGAISLPTGSGKSLILLNLAKRIGRKSLVVTPSRAITRQLYADFVNCFGNKNVGMYGDGKKDVGKLFTICVAQSLVTIEPGSEAWEIFSDASAIMWDECHTTPAETFEKVCNGLSANIPNRFFVSATHSRADGSELVLHGITGPIVFSKSYKELVAEGYLSPLIFRTFEVPIYGNANSDDAMKETRNQLYRNPNVNSLAADIASKAVTLAGRQSVIIIEEFKQFLQLKNFMTVPYEFVHGGVQGENKKVVPQEYWKSDTERVISDFNCGKVKCIIGTSAISTGVDLRPVGCLVYLQGGTSEVGVCQAIGRGTRLPPGKTDCWVVDFKVRGSKMMERHFEERVKIYETFGDVYRDTIRR